VSEEALQRKLTREKARREKAEQLLEDKSRELYLSYQSLHESHEQLEAALGEVKAQQQQLVQSEKLASLGTMSAGVAHEINNPLAFITSNVKSLSETIEVFERYRQCVAGLLKQIDESQQQSLQQQHDEFSEKEDVDFLIEDSTELISDTSEGLERIMSIVDGLKAFARSDAIEKESIDILDCVHNAIKLTNNQVKFNMKIVEQFETLPTTMGYPGRLTQVFVNMIINASQAIESDGQLTIAASVEGDFIQVTFTDNGCGIPQDKLDDIFTPFFTTKPVGTGTGLGLSISHGIVEEHQGQISVQSEENKGTCFCIRVPLAESLSEAA